MSQSDPPPPTKEQVEEIRNDGAADEGAYEESTAIGILHAQRAALLRRIDHLEAGLAVQAEPTTDGECRGCAALRSEP